MQPKTTVKKMAISMSVLKNFKNDITLDSPKNGEGRKR